MKWLEKFFEPKSLRIFKNLMGLILETILMAALVPLFWRIFIKDNNFLEIIGLKDIGLLKERILPVLWLIYGAFVKDTLEKSFDRYEKIIDAIDDKKKEEYERLRKRGTPILRHWLIAIVSGLALTSSLFLKYESVSYASILLFGNTLIFYSCLRISQIIENPAENFWKFAELPTEWLEEKRRKKKEKTT